MAAEPYVAAVLVRRLVDALVARGVDRATLLAEAGVPSSDLRVTRLRLRWAVVEDLVEAAERLTGDDRLGLHLVALHDAETLALPGFLFLASRTLLDAARRFERVQGLWSNAYRGSLEADPPRLRYVLRRPERRASVHLREQALADFLTILRHAVGFRLAPVEARFTHVRDGDPGEYEAFFGCPVRFGADATELVLTDAQLRTPLATANPIFVRHFEQQAEAALAELPATVDVGARVRGLLAEDLAAARLGEATVEDVARRMHASARTLQRRLGEEGSSFARELEAVRRAEAERLLRAGREIGEVSWRLGYADPAVFHRAFKRWTGQTPEGWRRG